MLNDTAIFNAMSKLGRARHSEVNMRSLEDHLAAYAAYHRDARNIATHFIGIPLIVVSLLALLSRPVWGAGWLPFSPACAAVIVSTLLPAVESAPWHSDAGVAAAVPRVRRLGGVAVDGGVAERRHRRLRHRLAVSVCRALLGGAKTGVYGRRDERIIGRCSCWRKPASWPAGCANCSGTSNCARAKCAMGGDEVALIPTVTAFPLQQAFIPLLEALTAGLPRQFPALIHSIYLYGSVARGEALPGVSDLDITLLLIKPADSGALQRLEAWRQAFQLEQRIVSKVDFDIGSVDEALAPEHHDSWGFWLKHHCRCLWGEDVSAAFSLFRPDRRIALAVNADLRRVGALSGATAAGKDGIG